MERVWCVGCFEVRELDRERRCVECGAQVKSIGWWASSLGKAPRRSTSTVDDYAQRGGPVPPEFEETVRQLRRTQLARELANYDETQIAEAILTTGRGTP